MANLSELFIRRPVATTLISVWVAILGVAAYFKLSVSPMPQVDFPTISVSATMPGASPETMATCVATPLERRLGQISDVAEMTSSSSVGSTQITLQFGLDRNIDGAARDVQAAINGARADMPSALHSNPTYRKVNPADLPVLILALTSDTLSNGQLYDIGATILQQRLSQVPGVGDVTVAGGSLPAVRVEVNPLALFEYGIGLEDVRAALASANANSPKGAIENENTHWQIYSNDQALSAREYLPLVVAYRKGAAIRLSDVAQVTDSVEDIRNYGTSQGKVGVLVLVSRQPGANVIETVDNVLALLPELQASVPPVATLTAALDRSTAIRASIREVQGSLVIAVILVILVVFSFLGKGRATLVPGVAVPISLIGTFGVMDLLGYTLDNFSLMALTIATGFVVDDAIVVMENIVRHIEAGDRPMAAAIQGVREVRFTVVSMSLSLIAAFIPVLFMGGIVGRLFREFAVTLAVAILISMVVSLTVTPMMCARILSHRVMARRSRFQAWSEGIQEWVERRYAVSLAWALRRKPLMMLVLAATVAMNIWLLRVVPKGFFPEQDTGRLIGNVQADQSISFQLMREKLRAYMAIIESDPDVTAVVGQTGAGSGGNTAKVYVGLKPLGARKASSQAVMARLRPRMARVPGSTLFLSAGQEIRIGARQSSSLYQYTLEADNLQDLQVWTPRLLEALKGEPALTDVNSDQQDRGLESDVVVNRDNASRYGLTASQVDNTLYDAFGQRQVSTLYKSLNQYHVVMVAAERFWQDPQGLSNVFVSTSGGGATGTQTTNAVAGTVVLGAPAGFTKSKASSAPSAASIAGDTARNASANSIAATGKSSASTGQAVSTSQETMVPLPAFANFQVATTPLSVNHQGHFVASTLSFNLDPKASLSDAVLAINRQSARIRMPSSIHGSFQGTAKTYEEAVGNEPVLVAAAIIGIFIVLGILYESYAHPITILSTIPSAGLGAVLALMLFNTEFSLIALIGVILLVGIVKKNAIMIVDFAVDAERREGLGPDESIFRACLLRLRPILMTTFAAMLGAVPLAIGFGEGSELRRPLGISIVGGLIVSQILTLYTTPVVYLYVHRASAWCRRFGSSRKPALQPDTAATDRPSLPELGVQPS